MSQTRRLAAILATDVAGYSRLMGADEEGTHERLQAHLRELVNPKVAEHRGRIVKNTGDGFLAEFASVVDAVRCAVEVQRGMAEREPEVPEGQRIRFRIGVNLGDVIAEEHDIFGDGVNVAARLEALAEPGGICVSRVVRDQVRDRLDYRLEDMGEQQVKNITRPVRVYALRDEDVAFLPARDIPVAPPISQAIAPRLSIVVLPFANLSDYRDQQYLADGVTDDLTTDLSRIPHMFVIARNTAFTYRDKPVGAKEIGRELGVRYVLEGSVRRSGNQIRVNAQLIDAETNAHLWAERLDREVGDVLALQDEITSRIANALNIELIAGEAARPTEHPDALDYILRGRAAKLKPESRDSFAEAINLFEHALALDPQSVEAQTHLAGSLAGLRVFYGTSDMVAAELARADALIDRALTLAPHYAFAHYVKGQVLRAQNRSEEAITEYETALASNPNLVVALNGLGWCKLFAGSIDEVIPLMERAIRRSPRDPQISVWHGAIGMVHLLQSLIDEAIVWLEKARSATPEKPYNHLHLAAAYALNGDFHRAALELAEARRLDAGTLYSSIADLSAFPGPWWGVPKIRDLYEAKYFAGLRKAGSDRRPRGIGVARTRHIRRSCALSSLTNTAPHSRASSVFPVSRGKDLCQGLIERGSLSGGQLSRPCSAHNVEPARIQARSSGCVSNVRSPSGNATQGCALAGPKMHCRAQPRGVIQCAGADANRVSRYPVGLRAAPDPCAAIRADPPGDRAPAVRFALERPCLGPRDLEGGGLHYQRH